MSASLTVPRYIAGTLSERATKAYFAGGISTSLLLTSDKVSFSTDVTSAVSTADLSSVRAGLRGLTDGTTKGFFGGGFTGALSWTARTDKLSFSSDVASAQTTANLSVARDRYHAISDGSSKGYFAGGQTGIGISLSDRLNFATETTAILASAAINRYGGSAMSNGPAGYTFAGIDSSGLSKSGNKFTFSTDSVVALGIGSNLSIQRTGVAGASTVGL